MADLIKLSRSEIRVGRPLPWPVFNVEGKLLLKQGHIVENEAQLERLLARGSHPPFPDGVRAKSDDATYAEKNQPFVEYLSLLARLDSALDAVAKKVPVHRRLIELSERIDELSREDADACLALIHLYSPDSSAAEQSLFCAFLCALLGEKMGVEAQRLSALTSAGLTANLALLPYQDKLNGLKGALTPEQRNIVEKHPLISVAALQATDVQDSLWLQIILQHHERSNGKGYPKQATDTHFLPEARIVAACESYLAMISNRGYRDRLLPSTAMLTLQQADQSETESQVVDALSELLGPFAPGCFVQLANQELALVTHRGKTPDCPRVHALVSASGKPFFGSFARDTRLEEFRPVKQVPPVSLASINVPALWD
ncbi:HD-GYP domain-containing protein [Marinimicrobium sp. ABcell2]|uniref:HD-GYP domain-containing protein n=1 Tax=Marinimicrobium sp. ABcell2 TaxID=3069751 RepID=UPI0027AF2CD3|nr:HD domain-containing phosphohydrolase [Marinimicrobium sp. ABcell2]MDQ2076422.1 HD domain-containing phosphohydrolase [Marinimicrobium sp. ABcell2]